MAVYSLSNSKISITVNSFGAELTSFKAGGTELLGQAEKSVWQRRAPVLFPIVGKLKNNQITYNQINYNINQHGFARDSEFVFIEQSSSVLEFELTANEESLKVYPFHFSLRIRYELKANKVEITYTVFNSGGEESFFSIGAHPGFNCKRISGETLNDFYLEFENTKELITEKLKDGLLSGDNSTMSLEGNKLALNVKLFDNDALVFRNTQIKKVKLCSLKSKIEIVLNCKDWPYFGIWTKKGSDDFVCLEPWFGITDSVSASNDISHKEGIQSLKPYCSFVSSFSIEIED